MYVQFESRTDIVKCVRLAVGGNTSTNMKLVAVGKYLTNRKWDGNLLETVSRDILAEVGSDADDVKDSLQSYKLAAVQGFLLHFQLEVYNHLHQKLNLVVPSEADRLYMETVGLRNNATHCGTHLYQPVEPETETDAVGQPLTHRWARQCTTGEAVFVDDILPAQGELYVELVNSTKANANILSVDPSKALAMPGVVGYIDHSSVTGSNKIGYAADQELFATKQVNWVGQTIGAIVADSHDTARRAVYAVQVEYEELPAILSIEDAVAHSSFHPFPPHMDKLIRGDTEAAMKAADHVIEGELKIGGQEHFYMETHCARAVPTGEDGEMDIYAGTQYASGLQLMVASLLNVPSNKINVHVKRMGGAFGGKFLTPPLVTLPVVLAAQKFNRPARCMLQRHQDMQMTGVRRPYLVRYKVGFDKSGKFQAVVMQLYSNDGFGAGMGVGMMSHSMLLIDNCYSIPNLSLEAYVCKTNLPTNAPLRGAGRPQGVFICEYLLRQVAGFLGIPAVQVQELNMYTPGQLNITNVPVEAGLHRCFKDVLKQSDFELERQRIIEFNQKCRYTKRAIDVVPVQFGVGMLPIMMQGMALLHVYLDGSILLAHGGVESGQGLHTKMIQVASRALNVPADLFHISETSTGSVPNASVTGGSSGSDINGMAVLNACEILSERLKPYRDANPSATWQQLVASAYSNRVNLSATGFFKCPYSENFDCQSGKGQGHVYNTYGAAVAQVEVDCLTGIYTILKVDIVMDVGKSLNPAIDIGQIEGGFVMGIGYHALEEHRYGPDGCLQTSGAGKYHIPSVSSIPLEMNVTLLKDSGNPKAVYSSKGIGEPSLLLSSAVFFAIRDAVVAARSDTGLPSQFTLNSPATVRDILLACTKA